MKQKTGSCSGDNFNQNDVKEKRKERENVVNIN